MRTLSPRATRGRIEGAGFSFPCAIGRSGISSRKREGDGATPRGRFAVRTLFIRGDRTVLRASALPVKRLTPSAGWCDAASDRNYNRFVRHPYPASAERMWRDDNLYDIVVVIGHNDRPRLRGRGSAIFMHVARPGYRPTEGCIALDRRHLARLLARVGPRTRLIVP